MYICLINHTKNKICKRALTLDQLAQQFPNIKPALGEGHFLAEITLLGETQQRLDLEVTNGEAKQITQKQFDRIRENRRTSEVVNTWEGGVITQVYKIND